MICRSWWAHLVYLAVAAAGCDGAAPLYAPTTGGYAGASISPRESWTARGRITDAPAAIDGDLTSIARSGSVYPGAELTIDLARPCLFQTVIIDHGKNEYGYCRRVAVATSLDGEAFVERHQAPGTRRVTILSLPEPVLARYVRVRAARPGDQPWSLAEVFLQ